MKKIILLFILLLGVVFVSAESICQMQGGQCYWEYELSWNGGDCPDGIKVDGAEDICDDSILGGIGAGASIVDITGFALSGDVCCLSNEYGGGEEDDLENQMEEIVNNNGDNILLIRNNIGGREVLRFEDDSCCAEEGETPEGFQECCYGMPVNDGVCGCPDGFNWVEGECRYGRAPCSDICTFQELFNNPEQCFQFFPLPYEQSCCFDVNYGNRDYFTWENVEVY